MGGASRASKKRAKKKQKKTIHLNQNNDIGDELPQKQARESNERSETNHGTENNHDINRGDIRITANKTTKRQRDENGSDDEVEIEKVDDDDNEQTSSDESEASGAEVSDKKILKDNGGKSKLSSAGSEEQVYPPSDCTSLLELVETDKISGELKNLTARQRASCVLNFLLQPADISAQDFFDEYWEKKALLIQQSSSKHRHRFDGLLSLKQIQDMLAQNTMCYGRDLNVTRYEKDQHGVMRRKTLDLFNSDRSTSKDGDGQDDFVEADPEVVWTQYQQGCSVRLLCPHKHRDPIHSLLHLMELKFGCMIGSNAYLTPPESSQGFAPHYDDIEAFCLQLEGKKRWKVYAPLSKAETLPRQSSPDFLEQDLEGVKPVMDVVLSPGDVLYMPRGWIHQACTLPGGKPKDGHSIHLTVSAMQQWAWVDLLELVLPEALDAAAASETSTSLREGLPIRFLDYMGAAHTNSKIPELLQRQLEGKDLDPDEQKIQELQEHFRTEAKARIMRVAKAAMDMLDASCDQISKQFISACQPPSLSNKERQATSLGQKRSVKILPGMLVRLVRPGVARLVLEEGKAVVYHCMDNSREYHGRPLSPLEFEIDDGPALEQLLKTTEPQWISVEGLFHDTIEDKVGVTQALFDEGLIMIRGE